MEAVKEKEGFFYSVFTGILVGILGAWFWSWQWNIGSVLAYLLTAYLTILLLKKVNFGSFVLGIAVGNFLWGAIEGILGLNIALTEKIFSVWELSLISLAIYLSYLILNGAYLFANPRFSWKPAIWILIAEIILIGLFYIMSLKVVALFILLILISSLLPLWASYWYGLYAFFFTFIYWSGFYSLSILFRNSVYSLELLSFLMQPMFWFTGILLSLLPYMIITIYPDCKHTPDNYPVSTSSLSFKEKFVGLKEVLMLALGFYSLTMDKYPFIQKIASWGRMLFILAMGVEMYCLWNRAELISLNLSLILIVLGSLLELSKENYKAFAFSTMFYGVIMIISRLIVGANLFTVLIVGGLLLTVSLVVGFNCSFSNKTLKEKNLSPYVSKDEIATTNS